MPYTEPLSFEQQKETQYRQFMFDLTKQYLHDILNCGKTPNFDEILKKVEHCAIQLKSIEEQVKYAKVKNPCSTDTLCKLAN